MLLTILKKEKHITFSTAIIGHSVRVIYQIISSSVKPDGYFVLRVN